MTVKVSSSQYHYDEPVADAEYTEYGYGNSKLCIPASIATLVTYLKTDDEITKKCNFQKTFIKRRDVDSHVKQCKDSDILLCSCYVWNWEITLHLIRGVKAINPTCLVICGGPQIPQRTEGFFDKHTYIDIIAHGEGEYILMDIFKHYLSDQKYNEIKGIETKNGKNPPANRIFDLSTLPSPYLTGTINELVDINSSDQWFVAWETNRGCPFKCTFCDWGSATATKMRQFQQERVLKEIEWFADNNITHIDLCDSNFGIFQDRDMTIAKQVKSMSTQKGVSMSMGPAWAKIPYEKLIPIAKELLEPGDFMNLSFQSMDRHTLDTIKRANIKYDSFEDVTGLLKKHDINAYVEIIMGLPGETLESFKNGLVKLIENPDVGKTCTVNVYHTHVLPNAQLNDPDYIKEHGIEIMKSPIFSTDSIPEYEHIITNTNSYTFDDLKEMYVFSWVIRTFHIRGITYYLSRFFMNDYDVGLRDFYDTLIEYMQNSVLTMSKVYKKVIEYRDIGYAGGGWSTHEIYGNQTPDQASHARVMKNKTLFVADITRFIQFMTKKHSININSSKISTITKNIITSLDEFKDVSKFDFQ